MELGNATDLIANFALAGMASLCLFWSLVLLVLGFRSGERVLGLMGGSLIFTAFYFSTIALSTGTMASFRPPCIVSLARILFLADFLIKSGLTVLFVWNQSGYGSGRVHNFMKNRFDV